MSLLHSSLWLSNIPLCGWTTSCLLFYPEMDIWDVSTKGSFQRQYGQVTPQLKPLKQPRFQGLQGHTCSDSRPFPLPQPLDSHETPSCPSFSHPLDLSSDVRSSEVRMGLQNHVSQHLVVSACPSSPCHPVTSCVSVFLLVIKWGYLRG